MACRLTSLMTFSLTVLAAKCHGFLPLQLSALIMCDYWEVIYIKHASLITDRSSVLGRREKEKEGKCTL